MATCVTQAEHDAAVKDCVWSVSACGIAARPICPPPPPAPPLVESGKDGLNLLGVYQICNPKPTQLAPYPPGAPVGNEAAAQAELDRLRSQVGRQSAELLTLSMRARRYRKLSVGPGFWVGLGLAGVGGALLFLRR